MLYIPQPRPFTPEDTNGREPTAIGFRIALAVPAAGAGYGAYTEIGYTCLEASYGMLVSIRGINLAVNIRRAAVNIAYGAEGQETNIVKNLLCSFRGDDNVVNSTLYIPIYTPPFTRISMNLAWDGTGAAPTPNADITLLTGSSTPDPLCTAFQECDTYGITSTTTPAGTIATTSSTSGAYGTAVNIGNPVTSEYKAVLLVPGGQESTGQPMASIYAKLRVGSTDDSTILNCVALQTVDERMTGPLPGFPVFTTIPAGTALSLSIATSIAVPIPIDWAAYCFK